MCAVVIVVTSPLEARKVTVYGLLAARLNPGVQLNVHVLPECERPGAAMSPAAAGIPVSVTVLSAVVVRLKLRRRPSDVDWGAVGPLIRRHGIAASARLRGTAAPAAKSLALLPVSWQAAVGSTDGPGGGGRGGP